MKNNKIQKKRIKNKKIAQVKIDRSNKAINSKIKITINKIKKGISNKMYNKDRNQMCRVMKSTVKMI